MACDQAPPRASAVRHLDPDAVLADFGAQGERAAVPGGPVQDGVGGKLRGDQDRMEVCCLISPSLSPCSCRRSFIKNGCQPGHRVEGVVGAQDEG